MKVDKETLRRMEHLARLDVEEKAEKNLLEAMNVILTWMEKLNGVDTAQVEPLTHMSSEINVMREDVAQPSLEHERGLRNAPKKDADYFRVPKVLE